MQEYNWKPGSSGNPNGRPIGARNKRTTEIVNQIIHSGGKDPLIRLSELVTNSQDESIAATASNMLAPFLHSKLTPTPTPRYIETELILPPLDSLANAVQSIALIESAVAENRLDVLSAQDLIGMINAYIAGLNLLEIESLQQRLTELESTIANQPALQSPFVEGGLPALPGTNITMPSINHVPSPNALGEPTAPIDSEASELPVEPEPDAVNPHPTPYYRT